MNKNYARKKGQLVHSMAAIQHRELAWVLYIATGFEANLQRAATYNAYTMSKKHLRLLKSMQQRTEVMVNELRNSMKAED